MGPKSRLSSLPLLTPGRPDEAMSSTSSQAPHPSPSPRFSSSTHDDQLRLTHHHANRQHRPQDPDVSYPVNSPKPSSSSVDSVRIPVTNGTNDAAASSGWSPSDTPAPTAPPPTFANQPSPWLQTPPSFRVRLRNFAFAGVKSVKDQLLTPGSLTHLVRAVLVFSLSTLFILVSAIDRWLGPYAYILPFSSAFCSTAPTLGAHLEGVILALSALAATFGYTWLGRLAAEKCNEHYLNDQGDGDHGGRAILGVWLFLGIFWMSLIRVRDQRYFNPGILFGLPLIIATTYHVDRQAGAVQLVWSLVKPLVFGALFALVVGTCLLPVSATFNLEKQVLRVMCHVMTVIDTTTKSFLLDGSTRLPTAQELNAQMGQVRAAMTVLQRTFLEAKYEITYSSHKPEDFAAIQLTLLKISQHLGSMTLSVQNERFVVYGPCNTGNYATAPPTAASATRSADPSPLGRVGVVTKELQRADPAVFLRLLDTFGPSIHEMAYLCELTLDRCVHQFIKNCRHLERSSALPRIVNDVPDNLLIHLYSAIEAHYQEYRNDRSQGIFANLYRNLLGLRTRHAPPNSVPTQPGRGDAADHQQTNTTTPVAGTPRADNQPRPVPFGSRVPLRRMTDLFTPLKQTVSPPALVPLSRPSPFNPVDPSATTTASTSSNSDVHRLHSTASSHIGTDMDNLCRHVLSNEPLSEADMEAFVRRIQQAITRFDSLEVTTLYKAYHHVEPGVERDSIAEDSLHPRSNVPGHAAQFQEPREEAFLIFFFLFSLREIALLLSTMVEQIHALQISRSKSQQLRVRWNQDFTRLFRRVRRRVARRVPGIPVSVDEPPDPRPGPESPERRAGHGLETAKGPRHWWSQRRRQQRRTRWRRDREYGKLPGGYTALSNGSESADDSDRPATSDAAQSVRQGLLGRDRQQVSVSECDNPEDGASDATSSPSARYPREPRARRTGVKPHRRGRATFVSDSSDDNTTFEETFTDRESRSSANEPIDNLAYIATGASPVTSTLSPFRELPAKGLSRWLQRRLWDILCWFRSPPVRYALKISLAITLISFPAWFDHSMYYYSSQKMQWITITILIALAPTVGRTLTMSVYRLIATFYAVSVSIASWYMTQANSYGLFFVTMFFVTPAFYIVIFTPHKSVGYLSITLYAVTVFIIYPRHGQVNADTVLTLAYKRLWTSIAGILASLIAGLCFWPMIAHVEVRRLAARGLDSIGVVFSKLVARLVIHPLLNPDNHYFKLYLEHVRTVEAEAEIARLKVTAAGHHPSLRRVPSAPIVALNHHAPRHAVLGTGNVDLGELEAQEAAERPQGNSADRRRSVPDTIRGGHSPRRPSAGRVSRATSQSTRAPLRSKSLNDLRVPIPASASTSVTDQPRTTTSVHATPVPRSIMNDHRYPYSEFPPPSRILKAHARLNRDFNQSIRQLQDLLGRCQQFLKDAQLEPRLQGPFRSAVYAAILGHLQNIVDRIISMGVATNYISPRVHNAIISPFNHHGRRDVTAAILINAYSLAGALRSKTPLPPFLPSARAARLRLINHIRAYLMSHQPKLASESDLRDQVDGGGGGGKAGSSTAPTGQYEPYLTAWSPITYESLVSSDLTVNKNGLRLATAPKLSQAIPGSSAPRGGIAPSPSIPPPSDDDARDGDDEGDDQYEDGDHGLHMRQDAKPVPHPSLLPASSSGQDTTTRVSSTGTSAPHLPGPRTTSNQPSSSTSADQPAPSDAGGEDGSLQKLLMGKSGFMLSTFYWYAYSAALEEVIEDLEALMVLVKSLVGENDELHKLLRPTDW